MSLSRSTKRKRPDPEISKPLLKRSKNSSVPTKHKDDPAIQSIASDPFRVLNQRMETLEASFLKVRDLLDQRLPSLDRSPQSPQTAENQAKNVQKSDRNDSAPSDPGHIWPLAADRNSRDAPMSLIRSMKHYILGAERKRHQDTSDDIVIKGIVSEELTLTLLDGFSQLSRRWLFLKCSPIEIRQVSPLLFASCTLAGLHINRKLHGSPIHQALYKHISKLLSRCMIISPLPIETIQSMLILSMWNLVPDKDTEHIDGWLLSGMAAMHGMLTLNFEQLVQSGKDISVDPRSREALRSWNLICLCHLQFSVGTGRPPVISRQYLVQCQNILSLPSFDSRDHRVAVGVKLYTTLCELVNSDTVNTTESFWHEIDDWKKDCGLFFELDSSKPLRFAYSCCYLVLARRTLKYLCQQPADQQGKDSTTEEDSSIQFIQLSIEHSHRILNLFLAMSDLTAFVRPAYENLLCSFAMVTLSEFATYLKDAKATLAVMETTSLHVQLGGKAEPVSKWALNVLRKYVLDNHYAPTAYPKQDNEAFPETDIEPFTEVIESMTFALDGYSWETEGAANQEFPSLNEMFLAN